MRAFRRVVVGAVRSHHEFESLHKGLHAYLTMGMEFLSAFVEDKPLLDRITSLSTVIFFVRIWHGWLQLEAKKNGSVSIGKNGMTAQTRRNLEICVGGVVNMLSWCSENNLPDVLTSLFGSDVVENFWYALRFCASCCGGVTSESLRCIPPPPSPLICT